MQDRIEMSGKDAVDLLARHLAVFEPMTTEQRGEYMRTMPLTELRAALAGISLLQQLALPALQLSYMLILEARGEVAPAGHLIRGHG